MRWMSAARESSESNRGTSSAWKDSQTRQGKEANRFSFILRQGSHVMRTKKIGHGGHTLKGRGMRKEDNSQPQAAAGE
jgi:hypothetical protein